MQSFKVEIKELKDIFLKKNHLSLSAPSGCKMCPAAEQGDLWRVTGQ